MRQTNGHFDDPGLTQTYDITWKDINDPVLTEQTDERVDDPELIERVQQALRGVDDPEYPGISVVDMGMLEDLCVSEGHVSVNLIPTFSGCPALDFIKSDIIHALTTVDGVSSVNVRRSSIVWHPSRLSTHARSMMAQRFTVAVDDSRRPTECPRCGSATLSEQSAFGSTRCRAIHRCTTCREIIEVLRA